MRHQTQAVRHRNARQKHVDGCKGEACYTEAFLIQDTHADHGTRISGNSACCFAREPHLRLLWLSCGNRLKEFSTQTALLCFVVLASPERRA